MGQGLQKQGTAQPAPTSQTRPTGWERLRGTRDGQGSEDGALAGGEWTGGRAPCRGQSNTPEFGSKRGLLIQTRRLCPSRALSHFTRTTECKQDNADGRLRHQARTAPLKCHAGHTQRAKNRRNYISVKPGLLWPRVLSLEKLTKQTLYVGISHDSISKDS